MFKKDFLMRQFEEFGKVVAAILGFKEKQDWQSFEREIETAMATFTGFELKKIQSMPLNEFKEQVIANENLSVDQTKILARLMFEQFEMFLRNNDDQLAELQKSKCLLLYERALENLTQNEFDLDIHYKLEYLRKI